jgi:hypothetical protein
MRSFLAGLALFLAFVTGTIALSAYVAETVLLDPSRAGEVVARAFTKSDVREEILTRAVPGYDRLDARTKALVDDAAQSARARQALGSVTLSDDGNIRLDSLRDGVASELRAHDQGQVASRLEAAAARIVDQTVFQPVLGIALVVDGIGERLELRRRSPEAGRFRIPLAAPDCGDRQAHDTHLFRTRPHENL